MSHIPEESKIQGNLAFNTESKATSTSSGSDMEFESFSFEDSVQQLEQAVQHESFIDLTHSVITLLALEFPQPELVKTSRFKINLDDHLEFAVFLAFFTKYGKVIHHLQVNSESKITLEDALRCFHRKLQIIFRLKELKELDIQLSNDFVTQVPSEWSLSEQDQEAVRESKLTSVILHHGLAINSFLNCVMPWVPALDTIRISGLAKVFSEVIPSFAAAIQDVKLRAVHIPFHNFMPAHLFWSHFKARQLYEVSVCVIVSPETNKVAFQDFFESQSETLRRLTLICEGITREESLVKLPNMLALEHISFNTDRLLSYSFTPIEPSQIENVTGITLPARGIASMPLSPNNAFPKVTSLMQNVATANDLAINLEEVMEGVSAAALAKLGFWFPNVRNLGNIKLSLSAKDVHVVFAHFSGLEELKFNLYTDENTDANYILSGLPKESAWIIQALLSKHQNTLLSGIPTPKPGLHNMTSLKTLTVTFEGVNSFELGLVGIEMAFLRIQPLEQLFLRGNFEIGSEDRNKLEKYHSEVKLEQFVGRPGSSGTDTDGSTNFDSNEEYGSKSESSESMQYSE